MDNILLDLNNIVDLIYYDEDDLDNILNSTKSCNIQDDDDLDTSDLIYYDENGDHQIAIPDLYDIIQPKYIEDYVPVITYLDYEENYTEPPIRKPDSEYEMRFLDKITCASRTEECQKNILKMPSNWCVENGRTKQMIEINKNNGNIYASQ